MSFEEWIEEEIKSLNHIEDLTEYGMIYSEIIKNVKSLLPDKNEVEKYLRSGIKGDIYKEHKQWIYRNFLICEGYIEPDEIS